MSLLNLVIGASGDDATELGDGTGSITDLTANIRNGSTTRIWYGGFRFAIAIAQGSTINSATFSLYPTAGAFNHSIYCFAEDDAAIFTAATNVLTGHSFGTATTWNASTTLNTYNSFDVTAKIQALINRAGWVSGNHAAIVVDGNAVGGTCTVRMYDGFPANAAKLDIDYTGAAPAGHPTMKRFGGIPGCSTMGIGVFRSFPNMPQWRPRRSSLFVPAHMQA